MRDIAEEVHQDICDMCDIDGWCLSNNNCAHKVHDYYCSIWKDRYDKSFSQKLKHKLKMTLHNTFHT